MTYHNGDGATVGGTGANAHFLRSRAVTDPHGGVHSRRNRRRRGRLQPRRLRDREDGADRPAVVHGWHGVRPQHVQSRAVHGGAILPRQRRRRRRRDCDHRGGAGGDRAARGAGKGRGATRISAGSYMATGVGWGCAGATTAASRSWGGDAPTTGSSVVLGPCPAAAAPGGSVDKYGWDFVPERDLLVEEEAAVTSAPPAASPAQQQGGGAPLRYLGRDACSPSTPCEECAGDCDDDSDCSPGLMCFERERGDVSRVPGCGAGGPGDIPGADYCYDPSPDDDTDSSGGGNGGDGGTTLPPPAPPSPRWLGSEGCTPPGLAGPARGIATRARTAWTGTRASRGWWGVCRWSRDAGWAGRGTSPEKLLL